MSSFLPEKKINGIYLKRENKYAVFSLSASYAPRAWDVVSFAEIAKTILRDYTIVLLGNGKSDREKGDEFLAHVPNPEKIDNLINKTTIQETVEIIRNSEFVIGNDSSAVHIAAATRTPSICIAPGAHYNRFVPYPEEVADHFYHPRVVVHQMPCFGCNYHCKFPVEKQLKCIQNISVPMVAGKLTELLNEIQKKNMKKRIEQAVNDNIRLKSQLLNEEGIKFISQVSEVIISQINNGGKVLLCGNGGSAADAQHFAAEFVGRFMKDRKPLPAVALTTDSSILTAVGNDYNFESVFFKTNPCFMYFK